MNEDDACAPFDVIEQYGINRRVLARTSSENGWNGKQSVWENGFWELYELDELGFQRPVKKKVFDMSDAVLWVAQ